jgi:hypothetical protein
MRLLKNFSKLQQLKHFHNRGDVEMHDFDEIFNPSQILELSINGRPKSKFVNLFQNIRILKFRDFLDNLKFDELLPQMKFLNSLTLKFTGRGDNSD